MKKILIGGLDALRQGTAQVYENPSDQKGHP